MSDPYMAGDLKILKLLDVQRVSETILAGMKRLFDAEIYLEFFNKDFPLVRKDVIHTNDFYSVADEMVSKLKESNKEPLWFDMSLSGFEELWIFYGTEESILKAITLQLEEGKEPPR